MWKPSAAPAFSPTRLGQQLHRIPAAAGALGCRIDGGQAGASGSLCRPGLTQDPSRRDRQALFVGDILATGYWAAQISQISPEDGARPGRRPHRPVHSPVRPAGKPQAGHRL